MNDLVLKHLEDAGLNISLTDFIDEFGDQLPDSLNRSNPPFYTGPANPRRASIMVELARTPFPDQADVVQAGTALLIDRNERAAVINAEMGTGKTMMAIAAASIMHAEGFRRTYFNYMLPATCHPRLIKPSRVTLTHHLPLIVSALIGCVANLPVRLWCR